MKQLLPVFFSVLCVQAQLFAQTGPDQVLIPDSSFRAYLSTYYSSAMHGNYIDTTDASVTAASRLDVVSLGISDLTGIQYFDNVTDFRCGNNQLSRLPSLPINLTYLDCSSNQLTSLPALPSLLTLYNVQKII